MKTLFFHSLFILVCGVLLAGCAGSPNVEFSPAEVGMEEPTETMPEVMPEEIPEEAPEEPEEPETIVAVHTYPSTLVSSAEKLYGEDPGGDSPAYREAVKKNPNLGYSVIYFDFNSAHVNSELHEVLAMHAVFMQEHPEVKLVLEGHADKRGTAGYNLALGERRALAVKAILQANGAESARINVVSYGEERPAVDGDGEEIYSRNRRVEMIYK